MQHRRLGNSDLLITPIGFGAWAIGGSGWQFAWVLNNSAVTGAIIGARSAEQVQGIMHAPDLRLSNEEITGIETETSVTV